MPGGDDNPSYMYQGQLFYPNGSGGSWHYIESGSSRTVYNDFTGYPNINNPNTAGLIAEPHGYQIYDTACLN